MSGPLVLALESSCDETGVALVEGGRRIQANVVASQVALHTPTGGIVPEVAARAHLRWVVPVLDEAWEAAGVHWDDVDAIAVTRGPGLAGSLLVGINFAKALAYVHEKPLVGVNHLEGHLYAAWLLDPGEPEKPEPVFPLVALIVSGGHTFLVENRHDPAQVGSRGHLRHDPAGRGMERDLAGHDVGVDPPATPDEGDAGLVAAALDRQEERPAHGPSPGSGAAASSARSRSRRAVIAGPSSVSVVMIRASSLSSL